MGLKFTYMQWAEEIQFELDEDSEYHPVAFIEAITRLSLAQTRVLIIDTP